MVITVVLWTWGSLEFIAYRLRIRSNSIRIALRHEPDICDGDSELAHLLLKTLAVHPGPFRGARDVAAGRAQRLKEIVALPVADEFFFRLAKRQRRFPILVCRRRLIRRAGGLRTRVFAFRLRSRKQIFRG